MDTPVTNVSSKLHRIADAAEILGISRVTLHGLTKAGVIRTVPIGTRGKRIPSSEIERFIRERLGEPLQDAKEKAGY